jgi:hypothetical protein
MIIAKLKEEYLDDNGASNKNLPTDIVPKHNNP